MVRRIHRTSEIFGYYVTAAHIHITVETEIEFRSAHHGTVNGIPVLPCHIRSRIRLRQAVIYRGSQCGIVEMRGISAVGFAMVGSAHVEVTHKHYRIIPGDLSKTS